MEGLENHTFAPKPLDKDQEGATLLDREARRIADMVQSSEISNDEAASAYEDAVARLSSSETSFDIGAFQERLADLGVAVEHAQEPDVPDSPPETRRDHGYPSQELQNVKQNLQARLDAVRNRMQSEEGAQLQDLIEHAARRRAVDSISEALRGFEAAQREPGNSVQAQKEIRNLQKIEEEEVPYSEEQLDHAKSNLRNYIQNLGLASDQAQTMNERVDDVEAPEDTISLVRALRKIERRLTGAKLAQEQAAPRPEPTLDTAQNEPAPAADAPPTPNPDRAPAPDQTTSVNIGGVELDPARFQLLHNSANTTGRGEQGNFYVHPDAPGMEFSADQVEPLLPPRNPPPPEGPGGPGGPDVPGTGAIFEGARDAARRGGWEVDPKNYIGITPKPLREILHGNPLDAQLFGELVMAIDPNRMGLFERSITGGDLSLEERNFIKYAQFEYSKCFKLGETAGGSLSASDLDIFMRRNPEIQNNVLLNGVDQTLAGLREEMFHLAMRDPERVISLNDAYKSLKNDRNTVRYQSWDQKVRALCERSKIRPQDYEAMFNLDDRAGTKERLNEKVREDMNMFGKAVDWTTGFVGLSNASRLLKAADSLNLQTQKTIASPTSWVLTRVNEQLDAVTRVMAYTITNPAFQDMLTKRALTNENVGRPTDAGPQTIAQMRNSNSAQAREYTNENLRRWFDRDKANYRTFDGRAWDQMRPEEKTDYRDNVWNPSEARSRGEGLGFWALLFSAFARTLFAQRKREAIQAE